MATAVVTDDKLRLSRLAKKVAQDHWHEVTSKAIYEGPFYADWNNNNNYKELQEVSDAWTRLGSTNLKTWTDHNTPKDKWNRAVFLKTMMPQASSTSNANGQCLASIEQMFQEMKQILHEQTQRRLEEHATESVLAMSTRRSGPMYPIV
ncbi:unnamed protein product, partial [Amoebophrya sp. A25]|eukprot:GSA25T00024630001.1